MLRRALVLAVSCALVVAMAGPALACAALIGRNGAVNLVKTTTLAAYHDGVEHYVTSFEFAGGSGEFGSIVPLPGVPTKVEKGGAWTLQRLVRETRPQPVAEFAALAARTTSAKVIMQTRIDALDITILEGGAFAVGKWAKENGFVLSPDIPEVLDFYAARSKIFMAAKFDADAARARGQQIGDGTPIHLSIPVANPWVPLRILGVGKKSSEVVNADVFLLTDKVPALLPQPGTGLNLLASREASRALLDDLRSDKGMSWIPSKMWLSHVEVDTTADKLKYDLAIDVTDRRAPSPIAAGFELPDLLPDDVTIPAERNVGREILISAIVVVLTSVAAVFVVRAVA